MASKTTQTLRDTAGAMENSGIRYVILTIRQMPRDVAPARIVAVMRAELKRRALR